VVFILATLLGFASHAPGSIGVFDAAMLVAAARIRQGAIAGDAGGVFRILYFLIPFGISISIMGGREFWLSGRFSPLQERRRLSEALHASAAVRQPGREPTAHPPQTPEARLTCDVIRTSPSFGLVSMQFT